MVKDGNRNTMKASRLHGIRDVRLEELPMPTPGPGEVLLKVASVGVCGSDVHYYLDGRIGATQVVTEPITMGHEFSAYVEGTGEGVKGLEVGQLVAGEPGICCGKCEPCTHGHPNLCLAVRFCGTPPVDGVFAEYTVMPAENCYPLPEGLNPVDGALLEPLGVAIHSVDLANVRPGHTVAVLGAGPIGLLTAAVARVAGATDVYMTEPLEYRRRFALEYVADEALNPDEVDVAAAVVELTGGRGVDVVFDAAGAPETPEQAAEMARFGGKLVISGIPSDDRMDMTASSVRRKGLTIKMVRRMKHTYPRAIRLVQKGLVDVRSLATHFLPLEKVDDAFRMLAAYDDGVIKAVIRIGG